MSEHQDRVAAALGTFMQRHRRGVPNATPTRRKGKTPEGKLLADILDVLRDIPHVLAWRCTRGVQKIGQRTITYGLADGASDIIGMVMLADRPIARFLALEVKVPGQRARQNQQWFLDRVNARGGYGVVVHGVDEALDAIECARMGGTRVPGGTP